MSQKNNTKSIGSYRKETIQNLTWYVRGPESSMRRVYNFILNSMNDAYLAVRKLRNGIDPIFHKGGSLCLPLHSTPICWPDVNPEERIENSNGIAFIADLNSTREKVFRVDAKKECLEGLGAKIFVIPWQWTSKAISSLQFCDRVIFYRVPYDDSTKEICAEADRLGIKKYYDTDTLIDTDLYQQTMSHADVLLTSTQALQNAFRKSIAGKEVYVWPDGAPEQLVSIASASAARDSDGEGQIIRMYLRKEQSNDDNYFSRLEEPLARILEEFPQVHCNIFGSTVVPKKLTNFSARIHPLGTMLPENAFEEITTCAISLIPAETSLSDNETSYASYLEASVLGIPSVLSFTQEFASILSDGEDAFLAADTEEWYQKIKALILSVYLRQKMAENAKKTVNQYCGPAKQAEIARSLLFQQKPAYENCRKTILYTNCYYGYTSFGGATVVAEGVAESIASRFSDQYNICVFTVHPDSDVAPGTIRSYRRNNVTVYSCSAEIDTAREIENEVVDQAFEYILRQIKPNLVHHHAVQGFGYGIAKVCKNLEVPYVATLHDTWAYCPRLFMSDRENKHCGEHGLSAAECMERCGFDPDYTVERRRKLKEFLQWAKKVYVPTDYFREVQSRYSPEIPFATNKNGIYFRRTDEKPPRQSPLKFLFVAGGQAIKGFDLLIDSLGAFADLDWELILVSPGGLKRKNYAGIEKHITFLGRQTQEEMGKLYRTAHVLLFPSLMYESFGLTVREAIANDCFVVASRCGGPSEAIVDGENGRLFDNGDQQGFQEILREILNNQEKYLNYKTTVWGDVRTFDNQADELLAEYDELMKAGDA